MLAATVRAAASRFGDRPAYAMADDPRRALTYRELDDRSGEVAAGLRDRGVGVGDVVALVLPPCLEFPVAYAAAAKLGAVTAGVNHRLTLPEQEALLARVEPRLVIADAERPQPAGGGLTVAADTRDGPVLDPLRAGNGGADALPRLPGGDRPVAICFTSGTTGEPKPVLFGTRQLRAITAIDVGDTWGDGGVSLLGTSFAHLGPMTKLPGGLRRGGTTHVLRRWRPDTALALTAELGATSVGGIPTQVAMMLDQPDFADHDLSAVGAVVMGGGPATPELVRRARRGFRAPVCIRYSCTEAGIGVGTRPDDPPEDAEVSVGRPHPGVDLAIRSEGREVAAGEVGEILLRSSAVMSGYLGDPAATAEAVTADGFVRTGDLGFVDDQGRLRLAGRAGDMYVRGGYNVHPAEVEAVLAEHPAVRAVAVVGVPDDVYGEIGVAAVVPEPDTAGVELEALRAFAGGRLARHKLPERLRTLSELPLTPGHKVDRAALRERLADRGAQPRRPR